MKFPFMFIRRIKCTDENGLKQNGRATGYHSTYVVMLSENWTGKHYASAWMDNPILGESERDDDIVLVPDVDVVAEENIFVFDSDDAVANELAALQKMKELWAQIEIPQGA